MHRTLKVDMELSMIQLLDSVWIYLTTERYNRCQLALKKAGRYTKFCVKQLTLQRSRVRTNTVFPFSPTIARVQQSNSHIYIVDLGTRTCTCKLYQENSIPFGHAIAWFQYLRNRRL
jgi:hypothetical protein